MRPELVLYDTHAWVWSVTGDTARLGPVARHSIAAAEAGGGLRVSAISVWEVAMLQQRGRLHLSLDVAQWIRGALAAPGTRLVPLEPEIAIESTRLPGSFHGDPADRILVATARAIGARLITRDRAILDYAAGGHLRILDASA